MAFPYCKNMRTIKTLFTLSAIMALFAFTFTGCDSSTEDHLEDAGDDIQDAAEEMGDATRDAAEEAAESTADAAEDLENKIEN